MAIVAWLGGWGGITGWWSTASGRCVSCANADCWCASAAFQVSRRKDWGKVEALHPNHVWQSDMTKVWAGPSVGWAYLVSVIDCCTREIVGWDLSLRCRTEEALAALNRAVLEALPFGCR